MTSPNASPWNAANIVTMLRIAMVPFFAWALLADGGHTVTWRLVAAAIFILAAATDRLDGYLARKNDMVTDLGKILDPIADKVLIGTALVVLSALGDVWWWVTVLILAREAGITLMRFLILRYAVMPASRGGKLKTVLQSVAIAIYLFPLHEMPAVLGWLGAAVMAAALVVTLGTGVDYAIKGWQVRRDARAAGAAHSGARAAVQDDEA
ncbi:CDP-diacylglycerol--glycerol-3-phosphate 3-phosphatidyltransferase [Sanguibacter antarcticus]|uniref:CDP-diacylglycerol--glycerol-3-phosphate 3-phosphatidyltransferase n=1 Tax=Sanguibacter antarcticus TaxID=372484 RepID=A0A2A9E5R8_9MICO|nr:CDP-diacylglycerol--glycerol-3-phosphate 3-phosphatidyltransferase [Sanguibacter antarcticus]PFG33510.1 CDP-diacylglycerol--glycerol-3-phosphate 3-phosphatidyltransferase [Sanguibacter antarcticus]